MAVPVISDQTSGPLWGNGRRSRLRAAELFPRPMGPPTRFTPGRVGLAVAAVLGGALLTVLRTGGHGALDTLWAEDARDFVADAFDRPFGATVLRPINGYLLVLPRLLAEPVTLLPPEWAAAVISTEVGLVVGVLALLVFVASGAQLGSLPLRLVVAVPLIVAPVGQGGTAPGVAGSVVDNVATLQFPLTYAVFWVLLWSPRRGAGQAIAVGTVLLTAVSTMLTVLYLPLALVRVITRRDRHSALLLASLSAGAAVQFGALATGYSNRTVGVIRLDPGWAATEYARWLVPNAVLGERWWMGAGDGGRLTLAMLSWAVVVAAVALALAGLTRPVWPVAGAAAAYSLGFVGLELVSFGVAADRYSYVPGLLLLAVVAALLRPRPGGFRLVAPLAVFVTLLLVVCAVNFRVPNQRANALSWSAGVRAARQQCRTTRAAAVLVQSHVSRHWAAEIACAKLR